MSSVRLSDIPRTTGFRLALLFLGLGGAGAAILFGFLYVQTAGFLARDVDNGLAREIRVRAAMNATELARLMNDRAPLDPDNMRPFALFDRAANWMAGSRVTLPEPVPVGAGHHSTPLQGGDRPAAQGVHRGRVN